MHHFSRTGKALSIAAAGLLISVSLGLAQPIPQTGTLTVSAKIPVVNASGQQIGSATAAAGSKVTVLREEGGKLLIATSVGQAWVNKSDVNIPLPTAPEKVPEVEKPTHSWTTLTEKLTGAVKSTASQAVTDAVSKTVSVAEKLITPVKASPDLPKPTPPDAKPEPATTPEPAANEPRTGAIETFLTQALAEAWADLPDAQNAASHAVKSFKSNPTQLPQKTFADLNGKIVKKGQAKGYLQVSISKESNHHETPGFPSDDMELLKTELVGDSTAIVEIVKRDWILEKGSYRKEDKFKKANETTILLSDYKSDSDTFLCRHTKPGKPPEFGRLSANDVALGGTALLIASVDWQDETQKPTALPSDFHYDKTLILPGSFAFLAVPFEKQLPKGVCVAASTLNVITYIDPDLKIKQLELFSQFNGNNAGATGPQLLKGLENIGFDAESINTTALLKAPLISKIQASLDDNRPLVVFGPGHALTIIGYDKLKKTMIVWDQASHKPGKPTYLPKGGYEVNESAVSSRFSDVFLIRKSYNKPSKDEEEQLVAIIGKTNGLQKHTLINSNDEREQLPAFARHAIPQQIKALLRAGRTVLIPHGKKEIFTISPQDIKTDNIVTFKLMPMGEPKSKIIQAFANDVINAKNVFYSSGS